LISVRQYKHTFIKGCVKFARNLPMKNRSYYKQTLYIVNHICKRDILNGRNRENVNVTYK